MASLQLSIGLDGKKLEPESNVLLASIENMQYAVTLDVLHMVFPSTIKLVLKLLLKHAFLSTDCFAPFITHG